MRKRVAPRKASFSKEICDSEFTEFLVSVPVGEDMITPPTLCSFLLKYSTTKIFLGL